MSPGAAPWRTSHCHEETDRMSTTTAVKGPASYFPSIEKSYGQPIAHWMTLLDGLTGKKHMEMVDWLKTRHGLGHGHANALVAYHRQRNGAA
jgi:hypothetical protein